jgi:superfamily I DNA and RNA helicase
MTSYYCKSPGAMIAWFCFDKDLQTLLTMSINIFSFAGFDAQEAPQPEWGMIKFMPTSGAQEKSNGRICYL